MDRVRTLSWRHGNAWLATHPRAWPKAGYWNEPIGDTKTFTFPASAAAAPEAAVAVELKFQTGAPSYFACLGGHLTPGQAGQLMVTIRLPAEHYEPARLLACVIAGLESLAERPAGHLEIAWFAVHPVDFSLWAWERSARTMLRLLLPDVARLSDAEATAAASECAAHHVQGISPNQGKPA